MQRMALSSNSSANVVDGTSSVNISAGTGNGNDQSSFDAPAETTAIGASSDITANVMQLTSSSSSPTVLDEIERQSSPHIDITNHQRISPNCSFRGQTN